MSPELWVATAIALFVFCCALGVSIVQMRSDLKSARQELLFARGQVQEAIAINHQLFLSQQELQWWKSRFEVACHNQNYRILRGQEVHQ